MRDNVAMHMFYFCMYSNLIDYWDYLNICWMKLGQLTSLSPCIVAMATLSKLLLLENTLSNAKQTKDVTLVTIREKIFNSSESQLEPGPNCTL